MSEIERADVESFVHAVHDVGSTLVGALGPVHRFADVVSMARQGSVPKSGRLPGGIEYEVHGFGCAVTDGSGREIDVDFLPDGTPIFDAWRLRQFVESVGRDARFTDEEVLAVCRDMVAGGRLAEPRSGWFASNATT